MHHDEASAKGGGCFEIETKNRHADPTSGVIASLIFWNGVPFLRAVYGFFVAVGVSYFFEMWEV